MKEGRKEGGRKCGVRGEGERRRNARRAARKCGEEVAGGRLRVDRARLRRLPVSHSECGRGVGM